jgi:hypothetical protein
MRCATQDVLAGAMLLAALLHAAPALALTQGGSLATAESDTDFYQVTCSNDGSGAPASLVAQVLDEAPVAAPLVSVQTQKTSPAVATNATDAVDGDAGASPSVALNGGAGTYDVFVDKSAAGAESYTLTVQCMTGINGGGVPTGIAITPISTGAPSEPSVPALSPAGLLGLAAGLVALGSAVLLRGRIPERRLRR